MTAGKIMICVYACFLFLCLPLAITEIVLGQMDTTCDITDRMGLNARDYLLGMGISNLILCFIIIFPIIGILVNSPLFAIIGTILIFIVMLFNSAWFIVGAIILFRSNINCINEGAAIVIFALIMWCLSALQIVYSFFNGEKQINEHD